MKIQRILSLLLALCFLATAFFLIGCGEEPAQTTQKSGETVSSSATADGTTASTKEGSTASATASQKSTSATASGTAATSGSTAGGSDLDELDGLSKHPDYMDVNFGGKTFNFAVQGWWTGGWDTYEVCAELTGNDNLIDEAIAKRNTVIETLYNCKITQTVCPSYDEGPLSMIANDIALGTCTYDFCMPLWQNCSATNYLNLANYLDLSHEWWDQSFIDAMSCTVNGTQRLYAISGQFNLISYDSTYGLLVNKSLYDQLYSTGKITTDIFQAVRDGKWTLDLFAEVASVGSSDTNGDQTMSYDGGDIFGCTDDGNYYGMRAFFYGSGVQSLIKTDSGIYTSISADNSDLDMVSDLIDKLIKCYSDGTITKIGESDTVRCIASGQSLFNPQYLYRLHNTDEYVVYGVDYGDAKISIVPFPKYSESQDKYYSFVCNRAYGLKISRAVSNPQQEAQFVELWGFHSAKIVYPEYIKCIKTQCLCDEEAGEMLNLVLEGRFWDFDSFKPIGLVGSKLTTFVTTGRNSTSRAIASVISTVNTSIAQYVDELSKISN